MTSIGSVTRWSLIAILATSAGTARADSSTASKLYADGQAAYRDKHFDVAAAKFVAAFDADPDPVYLFNAAQAYRFARDCVKSADLYHRFLAKVPNPPDADKIRGWSTEMDACALQVKPAPAPVPDPTARVEPQPIDAPPEHPGRGKRIAAYVAGGIGLVALGASAYFAKKGSDITSEQDAIRARATCEGCVWDPAFDDQLADARARGSTQNTRAVISLAVGGVGLAAGIALFVLSRGDAAEEQRVSIVPTTNGAVAAFTF